MDFELKDFREDVIEASKTTPVVIDFWAEWCGPCRTLGPTIEKLAGEAQGRWKLVKVDVEENQQLAAQFQIRSIPAVKMVFEGKLVSEFSGALPEHEIKKWLDENLPPAEEETAAVEVIEEALRQGERGYALRVAQQLAFDQPDNKDIVARMAMLYLPTEMDAASGVMDDIIDEPKYQIEKETLETEVSRAAARNAQLVFTQQP